MRGPRATGVLFFPPLAGPIEFSTGEIVLLLVVFLAAVFFVPTVAGIIGIARYRARTPREQRSKRAATFVFLRWAGATFLVGVVVRMLGGLFT